MANDTSDSKLHFSLVSPERELFSGDVDQVVVPGADGQFGALARHAPVMSVVNSGIIKIIDGSNVKKMFVGGGIVDVTPNGVTILAEDAVDLDAIDKDKISTELKNAIEDLQETKDAEKKTEAAARVARFEAILAAA